MTMKRIIIYLLLLTAAACQEKSDIAMPDMEPVMTTVRIDLGTADGFSKANVPLIPDVENLIHDVWVIQFSERGVLYTGVDRFYRTSGEDGARFLTLEAQVMSGKSTICLLANLNKVNTTKTFFDIESLQESLPDNLPEFRNTLLDMTDLIHHINTNTKPKAIPMFGYWEGTIGSGSPVLGNSSLNVTLGRMLCRVNVSISNNADPQLKELKFTNASNKAYYFPGISCEALPEDAYCTNPDANTFKLSLDKGENGTIYFYWAPNFCYGKENATMMTFTDVNGKSYSCYITNSSASDENCDYNMYHNCNYTISVTIE